jgi:hypothetical protein
MDTSTPKINRVLFAICGVAFAVPCLFFAWYTVRLIYVNLVMTADEAATHRTGGMLIGAIAFPLAAFTFGLISWFFIKRARRR